MKRFGSLSQRISMLLMLMIFSSSSISQTRELSAEGYGDSQDAARASALETLASSIFVQIESNSKLYEDSSGETSFSASTHSSTDLPLIGVELSCYQAGAEQLCQATMNVDASAKLYRLKSNQLITEVNQRLAAIDSVAAQQRYDYLLDTLALFDEYDKYLAVFLFLGSDRSSLVAASASRQSLTDQLSALEAAVPSLDLAAKLLTQGIVERGVFIQPATLSQSREVTPFAATLLEKIRSQLPSVVDQNKAKYIFSGNYQPNKNGISVSYSLTDRNGNRVKTRWVELAPASYQHLDAQPKALDFDQLLHQGYAVSSDFQVHVATNKGQRQLLFVDGEEIEILIKVNQPGYFYLVGHIKNDGEQVSYLLDLNDAQGDRRFVYYVNADQANKWVSIGSFVVQPPYGVESLQVIASQSDLVNSLPSYEYDPLSEYYVLARDVSVGVMKTRGLKKKKQSVNNLQKPSEAVLLFTTLKR